MKFPPLGFLGTFSMSLYIILWTYSEKFSLLRIYSKLNLMALAYLWNLMLNEPRQRVTTYPGTGQVVTAPGASCNMHG